MPAQGQWLITKSESRTSRSQSVLSASGAKLEIQGSGISAIKPAPVKDQSSMCLSDFGDAVIRETLLLLGRLETDRVNTVQSLAEQKERVQQLKAKIDEYSHRRMHFLPIAVQKEHELCAYNVQELKWHSACKGRLKDRWLEKVRIAENANRSVKKEIDYIKDHSPWAESKVEEERQNMVDIEQKQLSTDTELQGSLALLRAMEDRYTDKDQLAALERERLQEDVNEVRQQLTSATDELSKYKMHHTSFVHSLNDAKNRINEMDEESKVLETRLFRAQQMEQIQQEKVNNLKDKMKTQENEKVQLMEENSKLKAQKDEQKTVLETQNAKLELDTKRETQKLRELIANNRAMEREIRHIRKLINDYSKQKVEGEKIVTRTLQEMKKVEGELEILQDETAKVKLVNEKLVTTVEREKEKCETVEDDLRTTADSLKKQLKDEAHARMVLQARIAADVTDLEKTKADAGKKKDKGSKRATEIEKSVETIKGQVEKMEKAHAERTKVINELNSLLEKVKLQHRETHRSCTEECDKLKPKEQSYKTELLALDKKIDDMEWRTEAIDKRMHDMASSSVMMNRVLLSTQETIEELSEELNELNIQLQAGQGITETLRSTLKQVEDRDIHGATEHDLHMRKRETVLVKLKDGLDKALEQNKELARNYTMAQNQHVLEKDKLLNTYEAALLSEDSLKDKKEMVSFRNRLHKALECYYKLRGIQTRAGILRFEQLSEENGQRLLSIQHALQDTLKNIGLFLDANNKSHHTIRLQAEEVANSIEVLSM
eukprot:gene4758-5384_t